MGLILRPRLHLGVSWAQTNLMFPFALEALYEKSFTGPLLFSMDRSTLLAHPEHEVLKVSYFDQSVFVILCASSFVWYQQCALKAYFSYTPGPIDSKLGRKHRVTSRAKIAKIVTTGNPRWWPSWKSIFRFFSWTKRPVDLKLGRKHCCDL